MKYIITESQLKLLHEMSDDIPMFIKRRLTAINNALEHATSPNSVVQPEDYNIDYDYVDDVFNAVMDELTWETFGDGLTEEQESELREYLMEYHSDEIMDHYRMIVGDDDDDDEDLYESFDKIISEQSNVYTDEKKYKKALKDYNRKMSIYQLQLGIYNERDIWSKKWDKPYTFMDLPNLGKQIKNTRFLAGGILHIMNDAYKNMNNLPQKPDKMWGRVGEPIVKKLWEDLDNPKIDKWIKIPISSSSSEKYMWLPIFKKPNISKPIFKKLEAPKTVTQPSPTPLPSQPSKTILPKSVPPTSVQSNIDKTKPVDFYFGNRIFRAPNYQTASEFVRELAIKNFNSNMVKVYEHPDNERWFVGQNDKIYLNKNRYDEDPNKNVYIDPVKMGLSAL